MKLLLKLTQKNIYEMRELNWNQNIFRNVIVVRLYYKAKWTSFQVPTFLPYYKTLLAVKLTPFFNILVAYIDF